jgi:hypothetical protein
MNTYNFKMTRVYETNMEVNALDEQDAQKIFEESKYAEELKQCNVVEEKIDYEAKLPEVQKALLWYEQNGFECYDNDDTIYLVVLGFHVQVSTSEVLYRADLWGNWK